MAGERVVFRRGSEPGTGSAAVPAWLRGARLSEDARAELDQFYRYFRKRYGL